ncbi:MAG: Glycosyl transferase, group 1 [uncultured bacterium]|nr:MAG: Glycosyl transferase, group 1 [uncultured bacterium]
MKIGVNGYEAVIPRFGYDKNTGLPLRVGSAEFAFRLIKEFAKEKSHNFFIYTPVEPSKDLPRETNSFKYIVFKSKKLWTMLGLSKKIYKDKNNLDVFFSPTHYLPLFSVVPSVVSIFDLSYLKYPELFKKKDLYQLKIWGRYSIKRAKAVITISESSKNAIIEEYKLASDKVHVVYPGIKELINNREINMTDLQKKYGIKKNFILFVGTIQPRKNIARMVEAISQIPELELIVVGKKGWQYEGILDSPRKFGVENRVKFLEFVPDEELSELYKNAICFVLPSLYEGFGLPILEAMKYGCPVVTSNTSSLPEAGGDAALYFDPEDSSDIAEKIKKLLSDDKLREDMIEKGYKQAKKFSWEKAAKETLHVLKEVANA